MGKVLYTCCCCCSNNCMFTVQGYFGCATGKARQSAKTEIEKLKVCAVVCSKLFD